MVAAAPPGRGGFSAPWPPAARSAARRAGGPPRLRGKDLPRLKRLGAQSFCAGIGGDPTYEGRDLRSAHAGMNVSEQEFLATMDDIVAALHSHGVGAVETGEVVAILYLLKGDVLRL